MVVEVHRVTFIVSGARKRPDPQQPKKTRTMKPSIHNYSGLRPVHGKARALFAASSLGILLALPAGAATIAISNHSFEDPVLGEEELSNTPAGWTFFTAGSGSPGRAIFNPTDTWFTGSTGGTPAGADGTNVLTTYTPDTDQSAGVHQTIAGTPLTAGQTYTMTVAIGDYKSLIPNRWHLAISTSSMDVGSYLVDYSPTNGNTLLTNDAFTDFSVQYTATGLESQIGQDLRITIWAQNHGTEGGTHVVFDNVRLTSIPEPSAALLGGLGLLALLRRRR
jgi:hypothetical protein